MIIDIGDGCSVSHYGGVGHINDFISQIRDGSNPEGVGLAFGPTGLGFHGGCDPLTGFVVHHIVIYGVAHARNGSVKHGYDNIRLGYLPCHCLSDDGQSVLGDYIDEIIGVFFFNIGFITRYYRDIRQKFVFFKGFVIIEAQGKRRNGVCEKAFRAVCKGHGYLVFAHSFLRVADAFGLHGVYDGFSGEFIDLGLDGAVYDHRVQIVTAGFGAFRFTDFDVVRRTLRLTGLIRQRLVFVPCGVNDSLGVFRRLLYGRRRFGLRGGSLLRRKRRLRRSRRLLWSRRLCRSCLLCYSFPCGVLRKDNCQIGNIPEQHDNCQENGHKLSDLIFIHIPPLNGFTFPMGTWLPH